MAFRTPVAPVAARYNTLISGQVFDQRFHETPGLAPALAFIPENRFFELGGRFRFRPNRKRHRLAKRSATRSRTCSQGSPEDSPAKVRLARLSISCAHAACVAAAVSLDGSSRLEMSSAATSARSSGVSARTSRSRSWARSLILTFYAQPPRLAATLRGHQITRCYGTTTTFPNCCLVSRCSWATRSSASENTLSTTGFSSPRSKKRNTSYNSPRVPMKEPFNDN